MWQVHPGLKYQNLVKILTLLQHLLIHLENDSDFKYNIQVPSLVFMTFLNLRWAHWLFVTNYLCFFVFSRKADDSNDSNDSVNISTDENIFHKALWNFSSSSMDLSLDDKIHPSGSNEMRFANSEEIRCDHRLFDKKENKTNKLKKKIRRYEKENKTNELYVQKLIKLCTF